MGRFSIRIQVFFVAGIFVFTLLAASAISWMVKGDLQSAYAEQAATQKNEMALMRIVQTLSSSEVHLMLFALGNEDEWPIFVEKLEEAKTALTSGEDIFDAGTGGKNGAMAAELESIAEPLAGLEQHYDNARSEALFGQVDSVKNAFLPRIRNAQNEIEAVGARLAAEALAARARADAAVRRGNMILLGVYGVAILLALGLGFGAGRVLARPISRLADSVGRIANKDYESEIPSTNRGDEVGGIARNLEALRDQLSAADAAEARAREENGLRVDLFKTLGTAMSELKSGELSRRIEPDDWAELGDGYVTLCADFNGLAEALDDLVGSLRKSADAVSGNANELSSMSDEMSRRSEVQAATLEQSAAALDELAESVKSASVRAQEVDGKVDEGRRRAEQGGEVMSRALTAMGSIAKSSEQISQIITVIDDIAFQTNLLALNAGVEAARAGESGKGFSVVASEVRSLAQRASESASEIKDLVLNSTKQVEGGQKLVQETSETLTHIVASVTEVSGMVSDIATSSKDQASGIQEINVGVAELDKATQQNAAMVSQTNGASQQLKDEATRLSDLLARFAAEEAATTGRGPGSTEEPSARKERSFAAAAAGTWEAQEEPQDTRTLVHGNWSTEELEPEPLHISFDDEGGGQAADADDPPAPAVRYKRAVGDDGDWKDF